MTRYQLRVLVLFVLSIVLLWCSSCDQAKNDDRIQMIIDADTANEVDDLFAIVRAAVEPRINLLGITSAQFHISPLASNNTVLESQRMNEDLVQLLGRSDIALPIGSNEPLTSPIKPQTSEASEFIINQAHELRDDDILQLVILGSCTNVASAILQDPSIIPQISVHYIGFWHDAGTNDYNKVEFNSGNDTLAVNVLLDTEGLDFNVMTATTCQHLVFERSDVDAHLLNKDKVAQYLLNRWNTYDRWWTDEDPKKIKWIMWDVAIIEALIHPELASKEEFKTPPENMDRSIEAYTSINVDEMINDYWSVVDSFLLSYGNEE